MSEARDERANDGGDVGMRTMRFSTVNIGMDADSTLIYVLSSPFADGSVTTKTIVFAA